MSKHQTSFNPEWTKEHEFLKKKKAVETLFVDFAHCVTVKWILVVKGKLPLTDMPARKKHKSNRRAAGTSSLMSFFSRSNITSGWQNLRCRAFMHAILYEYATILYECANLLNCENYYYFDMTLCCGFFLMGQWDKCDKQSLRNIECCAKCICSIQFSQGAQTNTEIHLKKENI